MNHRDFSSLVDKYEKLVFTVCYQLVGDYQEAQNLTQETFLSAYQHIDNCRTENYKAWLARIASNKAKDYLKSAYFRRTQMQTDEELDIFASRSPSAEDEVIIRDLGDEIKAQIHNLSEPYLKVSVLYFLEEKSVNEIAILLQRPPKTVKTQVYRAKQILKQNLQKTKEGRT